MSGLLNGKVALITGTGGGQGREAALRFAAEGALVIGCDVKVESNAETERLVRDAGGKMLGMAPVDVGDPTKAKAWVDEAASLQGRIDIVYNNAAAQKFAPLDEMSIDDWHFTIRNELDLVFFVTRFAWPYLKRQGGVVITTASNAAYIALPGLAAHSAAKAGVVALSRAFALEGAPFGIRAVSISPGPVLSPATEHIFGNDEVRRRFEDSLLIKRIGRPGDIAALAVFLASDQASYITAADFRVDGGQGPLTTNQNFL